MNRAILLCATILAAVSCAFGETAGWENVCPTRTELPSSPAIWRADFSTDEFTWELREGALGSVSIGKDGISIAKTNDTGYIVVTARPFAVRKGQGVRFVADQVASLADVNYSSGALRYYGRQEELGIDWKTEGRSFWGGGSQTMRAMPCTAPGMSYRKYGQCTCKDDVLTPAIVVSGVRSTSVWSNWYAEDLEASEKTIQDFDRTFPWPNHVKERLDETAFDRMLAADSDHVATIERRDGFSRLVIDGEVAAPAVYHGRHQYNVNPDALENFAGMSLDGSDVRLHEKALYPYTHWSPETGFDVKALAAELKSAMRLSTNSLFIVGISGNAPDDFVRKLHPEEAWINEKGEPVYGSHGSCILGYLIKSKAEWEKRAFPWPSPSSRVWRDWVCEAIRATVTELKAQGLTKRIVGIHVFGYHDGQYSIPYTDHSKMAQAEYARMIAEPGCLSTNEAFCLKQSLFRAQEEFVRTFKRTLGKPSLGIMWCESPFQGARNASLDITSFVRSDVMDVIVCQPDYRERLPGYPTVSALPLDSLHLHGKMFWNEYDYRTYAPISGLRCRGPVSWKSLGTASDIDMWRTMYRKVAGEADATRMGYWLYDMLAGWYEPPEIADDIRRLAREEKMLVRRPPSTWRPDAAIVVDEVQILPEGKDPLLRVTRTDDFIYAASCRLFGSSGVPYERYLAEDVLAHPELLADKKIVIFAFLRQIDRRRAELLERLSSQGTMQVFLSETGVRGGAAATRFETVFERNGTHGYRIVPEPGVRENVQSLMETYAFRDSNRPVRTGERCSVRETPGVTVLARYADDGRPALAVRRDADCTRVYVAASGGLSPALFNRFAREAGAYVAVDRTGLQVNMNGDFLSVHCLQPGRYELKLPYAGCRVTNLKSGKEEPVADGRLNLALTAGETCRFSLDCP